MHWNFDNSYARLPARFYERWAPAPMPAPAFVAVNTPLAEEMGVPVEELASNALLVGAEPIAMAYAGHQFGHFVPRLGDGRALLLGEVGRRDIHLKGSGATPFSRGADGRMALGPALREYIVSEAMHALGIPTTRSLAVVATGGTVLRETEKPGAVLVRVASSHVRVGTFEYFAHQEDAEGVKLLADYVMERHYPGAASYAEFLNGVARRQASLIAEWMRVGFVHGVMNTDNMSIAGETIDYGPCAFLDEYHAGKVFSSIDRHGRYAFANQSRIAQWNLARLAESLLPLISVEEAEAALALFQQEFSTAWLGMMRRKLGLQGEGGLALIEEWLTRLQAAEADYTLSFHALEVALQGDDTMLETLVPGIAPWCDAWRGQVEEGALGLMRAANPKRIPRNHRIEQVIAAAEQGDFAPFHRLNAALAKPYEEGVEHADYALPPQVYERVRRTFCGT